MASAVGNPDDSALSVPSSITFSVGADDQLLTSRLHDEIYASNVLATGAADGLDLTIRATDSEGRETGRTANYPVGHAQLHLSKDLTGESPRQPAPASDA